MKKINRVFSLVLILSIALGLFVSCPNNTIQGSVERDGRNNAEILITGTINKPLTDSRKFTVTLNNATFRAFSRGEDVSSWFVDSEGKSASIAGLKYRIAAPVASGSNKATIRITGTPETASKDQIYLLIPCDTFQGPITIDVDTEGALRYNIIDYIEPTLTLIKEEGNDLVVDGMETKAIDEKRIKFQLNNAHFANSLKGNISVADGGDGTIIGAKSGGINFDDATDSAHLDFKWEIIENPDGDNTEIDLVITGTADKLRSLNDGDTFTITLIKELLYDGTDADGTNSTPTIIDDNNGEAYVKDIKVVKDGTTTPEVGVYNFTEVVPTLSLVVHNGGISYRRLSCYDKSKKAELYGTTDKTPGLGFNSVTLLYLLENVTVTTTDARVTFTSDNVDSLFGDGFAKFGLTGYVAVYLSTLQDDNDSDIKNSPLLLRVYLSKGTEDLHVSEGEFNFVLTDELISAFGVKKIGVTENYDKPIESSGIIYIKIEKSKPNIAKDEEYVVFTGVATDEIQDTVTYGTNTTSHINGGRLTLNNSGNFRFKKTSDVGTEKKLTTRTDNKVTDGKVTIEPAHSYIDYYYRIVSSENDADNLVAIELFIKQNRDASNKDEDGDLITPSTKDVTYIKSSSYEDKENYFPGNFNKDENGCDYRIKVTLDQSLFEQLDISEVQVLSDDATSENWVDYDGGDVVITPDSNKVRYRIMSKPPVYLTSPSIYLTTSDLNQGSDFVGSNSAIQLNNLVTYKVNADDHYTVNYSNQGTFSYGNKDIPLLGEGGEYVSSYYSYGKSVVNSKIGFVSSSYKYQDTLVSIRDI